VGSIGSQFTCEDFEQCIASVRKAEEAGYSHAWFIDSQILWEDCYFYMAHALAQTERITVGTAVTNPYTRHLTVTASAFATLAAHHPGRLELGIGRGDSSVRTMGLDPGPTAQLERAVPLLRDLSAGRTVSLLFESAAARIQDIFDARVAFLRPAATGKLAFASARAGSPFAPHDPPPG
jgi:alkanesulfonate monooxygenase SsuD/methylene tetrahydromethanopterin reductase-like flavin-dependent oxidoreductase (luciferase family)